MTHRSVFRKTTERQRAEQVRWTSAADTQGFTLIELMLAVSIVGILASLAIPNYIDFLEKARVARAVSELHALAKEIKGFALGGGGYPDTLAQIGRSTMLDPWGSPYRYYRINCTTDVEITHLAKLKLGKKRPPRVFPADHSLSTTTDWHIVPAVDTGDHGDLLRLVQGGGGGAGGGGAGGGGAGGGGAGGGGAGGGGGAPPPPPPPPGGGGLPCGGIGGARKDRFLVPLNSDFDVYSIGKDRDTAMPLSPPQSHDDVLRASDGGFYGLGKNF